MYLTLLAISEPLLASNNRGENRGNLQTVQTITCRNQTRTVLSGPAIKFAVRHSMQDGGCRMWRNIVPVTDLNPVGFVYGENRASTMKEAIPPTPEGFDDGIFGWMISSKGSSEHAMKAKGLVEVSDAISCSAFDNNIAFCQGHKAGATVYENDEDDGGNRKKKDTTPKPSLAPFHFERHWTRYAFTMTFNLARLKGMGDAVEAVINSLRCLQVGGAHSSRSASMICNTIAWRFHKSPGQGGMGLILDQQPDTPVDLSALEARAANLGISYNVAGMGLDQTVHDGIASILSEIRGKMG